MAFGQTMTAAARDALAKVRLGRRNGPTSAEPRNLTCDMKTAFAQLDAHNSRGIGDFRYVGFFKRVKGSLFATRDTYLYSPLCMVLAVLAGVVTAQ